MRIYYTTQGGHVHCRVFTTGKCGDLVFGVEEWPKLRASFLEAGFSTIEETGPTVNEYLAERTRVRNASQEVWS